MTYTEITEGSSMHDEEAGARRTFFVPHFVMIFYASQPKMLLLAKMVCVFNTINIAINLAENTAVGRQTGYYKLQQREIIYRSTNKTAFPSTNIVFNFQQ